MTEIYGLLNDQDAAHYPEYQSLTDYGHRVVAYRITVYQGVLELVLLPRSNTEATVEKVVHRMKLDGPLWDESVRLLMTAAHPTLM